MVLGLWQEAPGPDDDGDLIVVASKAVTWNYPRPSGMDAKNDRAYTWRMAETFKCPHCGALYEVTYDKNPSRRSACGALPGVRKTHGHPQRWDDSTLRARQNARRHEYLSLLPTNRFALPTCPGRPLGC
jgi:hypothetical protein